MCFITFKLFLTYCAEIRYYLFLENCFDSNSVDRYNFRYGKQYSEKRIFEIIQTGKETDLQSRIFDIVLAVNTVVNALVSILCTFDELRAFTVLFNMTDTVAAADNSSDIRSLPPSG